MVEVLRLSTPRSIYLQQRSTMKFKFTALVACVVLGSAAYLASCSPSSTPDDSGGGGSSSGGKGGSASAGKGGNASGGSGGSNAGGSSAGGGSAGGGSAGGGSAGGSMGGSGGSAVGSGGMAGMAPGGSAGSPPSTSGPGVFFSGADMNVTKLVATDAQPGYFYVSQTAPAGIKIEPVSDPALPAGTKYAVTATLDPTVSTPSGFNFIVGWNWRQDTADKKWNYFDVSQFAGVSFWVKAETTGPAIVFTSYIQYDSTNFRADSSYGGTCTKAGTEADPCPAFPTYEGVTVRKTEGWKRIVQRFSYNVTGTPDLKSVARIDLLKLRTSTGGPADKILITGLQLLKEADLPPL
jgi:hypothetical protein